VLIELELYILFSVETS